MTTQTVYSFSVKKNDSEAKELIDRIKHRCATDRTMPTFTACVIQGLELLEATLQEKANVRKDS